MPKVRIYQDAQGLPLTFYKDGRRGTVAVLQEDIAYDAGPLGRIVVPAGFESDGCSLPRFFWRLIGHPFDMAYLREAILHDWLYRYQPCDRRTADKIFREAMAGSVCPGRRRMIYWGLRIGGWPAWNRHRKRLRQAEALTVELAD
jgi:hypothetical protein